MKTIKLDNGKYTIVYDKTDTFPEKIFRYGEEWKNVTGDNVIFWLCKEIINLRNKVPKDLKTRIEEYNAETGYDKLTLEERKQMAEETKNKLEEYQNAHCDADYSLYIYDEVMF